MSDEEKNIIFCDGASKGNPGPGGWGAVVARADGRVVELGASEPGTTNNRMELGAAIAALQELEGEEGATVVYSDSTYVIRGITEWISGWKRKGWKTSTGSAVANEDQWRELDRVASSRTGLIWRYVPGHAGVPGNERADVIASDLALGVSVDLYDGPLGDYGVDLAVAESFDAREARSAKKAASGAGKSSSSKKKAYIYLSLVRGRLERHATWPECERRVKGVRGARFKKAISAEDEAEIRRSWGC
jgi:ribonuclease HI